MSPTQLRVCAKCRYAARGTGIDMRPRPKVLEGERPPSQLRSSLRGGDYICGRDGLTPAEPDPVTGFVALPSGPDCRDLNPEGRCEDYRRGVTFSDVFAATLVFAVVFPLTVFILQLLGTP